ncbi:trypco2 family protein [Streptomyces sp. NPDC004520]|uniref:trypco2 family protein n=1 Tax=Streptomyces sp. NPDC004520 TaxID=3364702 RepID=UPI0036B6ECA4
MGNDAANGFGLDEVLGEVSRDLLAAQQRTSEEGGVGLVIGSVEIELTVAVVQESKAAGRAGFKVQVLPWLSSVEAAGDASRARTQGRTHLIKLTLWSQNQGPVGA